MRHADCGQLGTMPGATLQDAGDETARVLGLQHHQPTLDTSPLRLAAIRRPSKTAPRPQTATAVSRDLNSSFPRWQKKL